MRVSIALAATCVTTSAVLMLSACGGSGSKGSDTIQSDTSDSPSATSPSASPSATAPSAAGRPTITFPADAKDVFEDQHTGDATKDAVLADNAQWVESLDDAIFRGTTGTQALGFYATGMGVDKSVTYVHGFLSKNYTWQGTVRFFDRKVTLLSSGTAAVIYCSDESKGFLKDRKTGKIDNTPTTADSYVLYNTQLKKNAQGVWQTDNMLSDRGAKQCQP
jgi:hypothetical protein